MVAEAAEGEVLIQAIMAQLQASAVAHVARQQAHGHAAARLEAVEQGGDAGQDLAAVAIEAVRQMMQVGRQKEIPVLRRVCYAVLSE